MEVDADPVPPTASQDAAEGAFIGALIGDACGATLEFKEQISEDWLAKALSMRGGGVFGTAPGQVTDDGELSLALGWGLVEAKGQFDLELIASQYSAWVESKPFDIGKTTRLALSATPATKGASLAEAMMAAAKLHSANSESNGALMRAVPLAVWAHRLSVQDLVTVCRLEVSLTHPSVVVQDAEICYCLAIGHLIRHPQDRRGAWQAARDWAAVNAAPEVQEWLAQAAQQVVVPYSPQIGWIRIAFVHAFRHLIAGTGYYEALRETLKGGGDTDTNAAIVGGLIGAAVGVEGIPQEMRTLVLRCNIALGKQAKRPKTVQTAASFKRIFVALYHLAPERLSAPAASPRKAAALQPAARTSPNRSPSNSFSSASSSSVGTTVLSEAVGLAAAAAPDSALQPALPSPPPPPFVWPFAPIAAEELAPPPPSVTHILIGVRNESPYLLDFGLPDGKLDLYQLVSHSITISNASAAPISVTPELLQIPDVHLDVTPAHETLTPGQSTVVTINLVALRPQTIHRLIRFALQVQTRKPSLLPPLMLVTYLRAVGIETAGYEIEWSSVSGGTVLGEGAAGSVRKTTLNGKTVAVKEFLNVEGEPKEVVSDFYREVQVLLRLRHPNIVRLIGACTVYPKLAVVMEFAPHGSLSALLADRKIDLPWALRLKLATDIAKGCHYLHCNQVFHRDLKSPNILVMSLDPSDGVASAVVTDFNASKFGERTRTELASGADSTAIAGTVAWSAPEVQSGASGDYSADVYSFAIILWELAARVLPFSTFKFHYQTADHVNAGGRMPIPAHCLPRLAELIHHCWAQSPDERPSFAEVLSDLRRIRLALSLKPPAVASPPPIDVLALANKIQPADKLRGGTLIWVDDKDTERLGMARTLSAEQRKAISFVNLNSTQEMAAWLTAHEDEVAFNGGDRALRIITNRYREKDGGASAAEKLLLCVRNPAECPFPKAPVLVYCADLSTVSHLRDRITSVTNQSRVAQRFAGFERLEAEEAKKGEP